LSIVVVALICAAWFAPPAFADSIPPKVDTTTPWGMSPADAQFRLDVTDLSIGPLTLERFTQSPAKYWPDDSAFGLLMTSNFDIYVMANYVSASGPPDNVTQHYHATVHIGNSAVGTYWIGYPFGSGEIMNDNGDSAAGNLTRSGTTLLFTDKDGNVYTFSPPISATPALGGVIYEPAQRASQRVDHINFIDGRVRQFSYDSSQRLKLVTDSTGYAILFDYGTNNMVASACAVDLAVTYVTAASTCTGQPLKVTYQYGMTSVHYGGTAVVLTGFTDVLGNTTTYTLAPFGWGAPQITCIKPPDSETCRFHLTSDSTGAHQTLADGAIWTFVTKAPDSFAPSAPDDVPVDGFTATVTDPAGKTSSYDFYKSSPDQNYRCQQRHHHLQVVLQPAVRVECAADRRRHDAEGGRLPRRQQVPCDL
jgi:hypothetical protein